MRGGTEIYYERTMDRWTLPNQSVASTAAMAAMMATLAGDPEAHVHQRTLSLTRHQARQIALHLDRLLESLEPAKGPAQEHSVMVAVYAGTARPPQSQTRR